MIGDRALKRPTVATQLQETASVAHGPDLILDFTLGPFLLSITSKLSSGFVALLSGEKCPVILLPDAATDI
jgi:hypothetical protein